MGYHILAVEDDEDARAYLKALLEEKGHYVTEASNGPEALRLLGTATYDMVISDVRMPVMNGLELLRKIKDLKPGLPVVMISAYKETEQVLIALRDGACDFLNKPYEERDIMGSLSRVTRLVQRPSFDHPCIQYLHHEEQDFVFENEPERIELLAHFLSRNVAAFAGPNRAQSMMIALLEALSNAVYHGNLEIPSDLKHEDEDGLGFLAFNDEANKRKDQAPYNTRKVYIHYHLSKKKLQYVIRDEGQGFDYHNLPDPLDFENQLKPSGRGIMMIRNLCDEIHWNESGNEITLIQNIE